jgi:hypothetical protein
MGVALSSAFVLTTDAGGMLHYLRGDDAEAVAAGIASAGFATGAPKADSAEETVLAKLLQVGNDSEACCWHKIWSLQFYRVRPILNMRAMRLYVLWVKVINMICYSILFFPLEVIATLSTCRIISMLGQSYPRVFRYPLSYVKSKL